MRESKTLFKVFEKANPENIKEFDWQNASELVRHGFWGWHRSDGRREFERASAEAAALTNDRLGIETETESTEQPDAPADDVVEDLDVEDDEEEQAEAGDEAAEEVAEPVVPTAATVPVPLEDMSREELLELAEERGVKVDKRLGTKNLINAIRGQSDD